uniref:Integrase catalytic domain-containing protein n=1 Tax=Cacopsylla melanoneura TaxID=428564 RepID=A0A8D9E595_9HEMI
MSTTVQKERLRSAVSRRDKHFERMQKLYDYTIALTEANAPAFLARFDRINEYYTSFDTIQDEIDTLCAAMDPSDKVDTAESRANFEEMYYDTKAFVQTQNLIPAPTPTPTISNVAAAPLAPPVVVQPKLPKLEVPVFSGDLKEWSNFHSLYRSTIHRRTDITEVEKLQYLRSFLRGTPLHLIENFQILDGNYHAAYKTLCDRYENKRVLASHHLNMILNFKPLPNNSVSGLRQFLEVFQTNVAAVKNLGLPDLGDFLLVQIALRALNVEHKRTFEDKLTSNTVPTYTQILQHVTKLCVDSEMVQFATSSSSFRPTVSATSTQPPRTRNSQHAGKSNFEHTSYLSTTPAPPAPHSSQNLCPLCHQVHTLFRCAAFLKLDVAKRIEILKSNNRCFNCLGTHRITECRSTSTCYTCHKRHHSLIHRDSNFPGFTPSAASSPKPTTSGSHTCGFSRGDSSKPTSVLLGTAQAVIVDNAGNTHPIRLVCDPGSQISIISESCVQRIGLKRYTCDMSISGVGDNTVPENNGAVSVVLSSCRSPNVKLHTEAFILKRISSHLPSVTIAPEVFAKFSHLPLADPTFYEPGAIDFLLGADLYAQILCTASNSVIPGTPAAMNTSLGWIVFGRAPTYTEPRSHHSFFITSPSLESTLQKFWETEEVAVPLICDPEDVRCEEHFIATHRRDESGRYVVSLPFRDDVSKLGENHTRALSQYLNLEKRLNKDDNLRSEYNLFFEDYVTQGHMQKCNTSSSYIIPHHAVLKTTSSTTKVRAVFNASASSSTQTSLNDFLMKGPKLQKDICNIILSYRSHAVVLCADIKQMYRQILLDPNDRKFQHIFWRQPQTNEILEFELNTVTYGISPSAYQAQRVLKQLVVDEGHNFPLASKAILHDTYIDDVVSGASSEQEALRLQQELVDLLKKGCFELRKWASNSSTLLESVPHDHREKPLALRENEEPTFKILGLHWDPASDTFSYHVSDIDVVFTKRSILSHVARMFDPLGWLSPVIFWAKYLLQLLWLAQHTWDDPITPALANSWSTFSSQLSHLQSLRIPRFVDTSAPRTVHVVGFCDASTKGYAAVVYLVTSDLNRDENRVYLLKAKSKVAPTKSPLSIPRLELCGALLLAKLYDSLKYYLSSFQVSSLTFYSDSNIVLAWVRTPPHTLKTYVGNRIVEIKNLTPPECAWYHVPGEENPADCASRGLLPVQYLEHVQWLHGPSFLRLSREFWPHSQGNDIDSLPELKDNSQSLITSVSPSEKSYLLQRCEQYSELIKTQRVLAFVLRFIGNLRKAREQRAKGPLQVSELAHSMTILVSLEQQHHLPDVLSALRTSGKITNSSILKLTPFLDEHGIIRVGGRLRNASNLTQDSIHPPLLTKHCHLSSLLCDYYHKKVSLHAGPRTVQALIQQKYWIISLRDLLRHRIFKCLRCYRFSAKPIQPIMSDLPERRITRERPFLHVGVDFGGPFHLKESNRRNSRQYKAYVCLFVCFTTKALHLELVTELTSAAFLACFDRFISRRGLPHSISSDNGTNFVAASRELKEVYLALQQQSDEINDVLASRQIHWYFNCPSASNFGGLWEAGIKSVKHHLRRVIGEQILTYELFLSFLIRCEAILNSRPLVDVSPDPIDGLDYLTPGHFLIGCSLLSPAELDLTSTPMNRLTRWKLIQQAAQSFWKVWSTSYLQSLIPRSKWFNQNPQLKTGDLVLLPKASKLPLHWPLGRIIDVFPGTDNVTRVCKIKLQDSVFTRPVNKLIPLNFSA